MQLQNQLQLLLNNSEKNDISLLWEGNNGWLIHHEQALIAFDLDLFNVERIIKTSLDTALLCEKLDMLFITHEHEDHFNAETCRLLNEHGHCKFVIPISCQSKARSIGLDESRVVIVKPSQTISTDDVFVKCIRAVHGHIGGAVYSGASMGDCGYLLKLGGKTLYQPGDTVLLEEHSQLGGIDVLFLSSTEHNMWIDNSVRLVDMLTPNYIFPQHHSTYVEAEDNLFWTHGYIAEVYNALADEYKQRFHKLSIGEIFRIS